MSPMGHIYADTDRTTNPTQNTERCDDMKKMLKKVLCAGLLVAMSFTALSTQAFAYNSTGNYSLVYSNSTSPQGYVLEQTFTLQSSGADRIIVRSDVFRVTMAACTVKVECTNRPTYNVAFISSAPGTATIEYAGDYSPKAGAYIVLHAYLENYIPSQYVRATGQISV